MFVLIPLATLVFAATPFAIGRRAAYVGVALTIIFLAVVSAVVFGSTNDTSFHTSNWHHRPGIHAPFAAIVAFEIAAAIAFAVFARKPWALRLLFLVTGVANLAFSGFLILAVSE